MKIDFLISKMSGGGAERVVSILANYLDEKKYSIRIITFTGSDSYELNESIKRIKLHKHPLFHSVVFNGFFSLLRFYSKKSNRPDVISSHINLLGYMTIPIAKIYSIKIAVSEHMNHSRGNTFAKKVLRNYIYPLSDAVTILTNYDSEYFKKRHKNVWLMPNPCSFENIGTLNAKKNSSKEIIAIGNLDRYTHKGFDNLILIAKKLIDKHPDWKFKIIGGGDEGLKFLKQEVKSLDLENNVIFTGFRTDIKKLLSECDIFILPSRFEGLPMTLLEAMSQGVCCIAYDCVSGPSDVITNNVDGLLIEDQNIEAMASGLNKLIENEDLRIKLKSNAPKALEKFSIDTIGDRWISLFKQITV